MKAIDTDISKVDRPRAIKYLQDKYGNDYVCQIVTFGQYKLKNTIKAVLSAERGFTADYQNSITKIIPDTLGGGEYTVTYQLIEDIVNNPNDYNNLKESEIKQVLNVYTTLQEVFQKNPEVKDALKHIVGGINSLGIHAGGVIISSKVLKNHVPLMKGSDTAVLNVCQADMEDMHFLRALKIDALGLKSLSQIHLCMQLTGLKKEWLSNEDTSDENVYKFLREGNTANIFQMQKFTPTKMIKDYKVNNLFGLTAVNALDRPGPLTKGIDGLSIADKYGISIKDNNIPTIHPAIDKILEETNGQLLYQEQCMKIGQVMAGYSLGESDIKIRKTITKKKVDKLPEVKNEFIYGKKSLYDDNGKVIGISEEDANCPGAIRNGFSEELASKIFAQMESFGKYAFNKSHKS